MSWPTQIGAWQVGPELGAGGTAEVRLGLGRGPDGASIEVALKRPVRSDEESLAAVRAEAALLVRVRHEHVVRFIELVDGTPPVLVLERLRGRPLGELTLEATATVELLRQAAAALAAVHAAADDVGPLEAVHRDVAPDNLFVGDDGRLTLFDFALAAWRDHPARATLQGRVAYMAPEQARGEAVDASADVFSLGVVAWEALTGERLFWRGNQLATLRAVVDEPIARLSEHRPELTRLDALLGRMLDRDRARRPPASEVEAALRTLAR